MSAQKYYNGLPHPPEIYRRRRIAAAVIVLVVFALIIWVISALVGGDDSKTDSTASTTTSASATSSASVSSEATASASATSAAADTTTAEQAAAASETVSNTCDLGNLQLAVSSDKDTYTGGELPKFTVTATNPTAADCHIDLGANVVKFEVTKLSDNSRQWGDIDCNAPSATGTMDVAAGKSTQIALTWSRTTSAADKCQDRVAVPTGAYAVTASIGSNASSPHTFNIA